MRKIDLRELTANIPHILSRVPNRKSRLGANFYQPLVVEICRNTCRSRDKTPKLLQNHSVSHHTHSQHSWISFLWFRVICGSIAMDLIPYSFAPLILFLVPYTLDFSVLPIRCKWRWGCRYF